MYPRYASLVIAAFAATLTACGSDTTTNVLPGAEPVVSAPDYAVTLADGTIQLTVGEVKAFTVSSRVKKSRTVRWSSSNTTVATVSSTGTVTAKTVGTALVTATASNGAVDNFSTAVVSGTASVASAAKVASVQVSAPATTMTLGAAQTATATARDSAGTVLTGRTVTWSVSSGTSLMVNASGVVTALAGGTESVVATVDGVKGAQTLTVATVTSVAVSPKTGTALAPAQTRQFTTVATWSDQVTRPVSITYTATGGTISTSGLYTAGQLAGTFMVIANCACGRADTAAVSIAAPVGTTSTLAPWSIVRDFNTGALGTVAQRTADGFDDVAANSVYSKDQSVDGTQAVRLSIDSGSTGWGTFGGIIKFPRKMVAGDELWIDLDVYFPESFDFVAAGNGAKFLRVDTKTAAGDNGGYNNLYFSTGSRSSYLFQYIKEIENQWLTMGKQGDLTKGQWHRISMHIRYDAVAASQGGKSQVRIWQDGLLILDAPQTKTLTNATDYATTFYLFTYWNLGAPKAQQVWADNIKLASFRPAWAQNLQGAANY